MATSIISNLFGVDPAAYQQAQQTQGYNQDYQAVQLDPLQQANLALRQGGRGLGQVGGSLMGMQDPMLAKASMAQQLSSKFDTTTSDGLRQYAQALIQSGAPDLAQIAVQRADEIDVSKATVYQKMKEAQPKTEEVVNQGVYQDFLNQAGGDKVLAAKMYKAAEDMQKLQRSAASGNKITVAGQKNVLEVDKKDAENLVKIRDSAENVIPRLQEQSAALQKGIAAGSFSDARVAFSNALSTLGVKDAATLNMLKNTKTFNANRIELASAVAKQLGVNPTDRDFQASLSRFASASDAPETSAAFINDMLKIQQTKLSQANEGLSYFRKNDGSFAGYDRPLPISPVVSGDPFAGKSLQDLYKMREAAKKNK